MSSYLTYTKFYTIQDTGLITWLLDQHNIPYYIEKEINQLDDIIIGHSLDPMYTFKIPRDSFNPVNALLASLADNFSAETDPDYYLNTWSSAELLAILNDPNEWNDYDRYVARKLLISRKEINGDYTLSSNYADTYKAERLDIKWVIIGYFFSLFAFIGMVPGLSINGATKTLRNGSTVNMYSKSTIRQGEIMLVIGSVITAFFLLLKIQLFVY